MCKRPARSRPILRILAVALLLAATGTACTGQIGHSLGGGSGASGATDGGPLDPDGRSGPGTFGPAPAPVPGGGDPGDPGDDPLLDPRDDPQPDEGPAPDPDPGADPGEDPGTTPDPGPQCLAATQACDSREQCCAGLDCDETSLGQVCCGNEGTPCATANGEDCCGALLCIDGRCGYALPDSSCQGPCTEAPALVIEKHRLATIGGTFLGICGDANHTYGYHVPAARLPGSDYSLRGAANTPVCQYHAAAIDIGMDWPASRDWLRWLIREIREGRITGIYEVIGSYDGVDVRYWSDDSGWETNGVEYTGEGHDTHTHVSIYRSTALEDHGILRGWTATAGPP